MFKDTVALFTLIIFGQSSWLREAMQEWEHPTQQTDSLQILMSPNAPYVRFTAHKLYGTTEVLFVESIFI